MPTATRSAPIRAPDGDIVASIPTNALEAALFQTFACQNQNLRYLNSAVTLILANPNPNHTSNPNLMT